MRADHRLDRRGPENRWSRLGKSRSGKGRWMKRCAVLAVGGLLALSAVPAGAAAGTLQTVRERGTLNCGVADLGPGMAAIDANGRWSGFFVDLCRAVAAAVLKDAEAVAFIPATMRVRLDALLEGAVDVLMTPTTWTLGREIDLGLRFPAVALYDGQGFLIDASVKAARARDVASARVCVVESTTSQSNLADHVRTQGLGWTPVLLKTRQGRNEAFLQNRCEMMTGDRLELADTQGELKRHGRDVVLLPDVISREPVGPTVRQGDSQWESIIRWIVHALVLAEEKGITAASVDRGSGDPVKDGIDQEAARMLGGEPGLGKGLGLDAGWARRAIRTAGNYGELFDRHLGPRTPMAMDRGLNALWTKGGLLYSPAFR